MSVVVAKVRLPETGTDIFLWDDGLWRCMERPDLAEDLNENSETNANNYRGPQWGRFGAWPAQKAAKQLGGDYEVLGDDEPGEPGTIY